MRGVAVLVVVLLAGCGGQSAPTVDTACSWVRIVPVAAADVLTEATARDLLAHNLAVERNCGRMGR